MLKPEVSRIHSAQIAAAQVYTASAHIRAANLRSFSREVDTAVRCLLEEITQAGLAGQIVSSAESRHTVSVKPEGQRRRDRSENFPSDANSGSLI